MKLFFFILVLMPFLGCGAMLCTKGETKQGLFFNFGSDFGRGYVDIAHYPTFHEGQSFVKKLIVDDWEGFLLVSSQKSVHCDNKEEMDKAAKTGRFIKCEGHKIVEGYKVRRYTDNTGYEEWEKEQIPKQEWQSARSLNHVFSKKPVYHYENCRYHFFGKLIQILQIIDRV